MSEALEATFLLKSVQPADSGTWVYVAETRVGMAEKTFQVAIKGK